MSSNVESSNVESSNVESSNVESSNVEAGPTGASFEEVLSAMSFLLYLLLLFACGFISLYDPMVATAPLFLLSQLIAWRNAGIIERGDITLIDWKRPLPEFVVQMECINLTLFGWMLILEAYQEPGIFTVSLTLAVLVAIGQTFRLRDYSVVRDSPGWELAKHITTIAFLSLFPFDVSSAGTVVILGTGGLFFLLCMSWQPFTRSTDERVDEGSVSMTQAYGEQP